MDSPCSRYKPGIILGPGDSLKSLLSWSLQSDVREEDKNDHLREVQTGMSTLKKWLGYTKRIGGKAQGWLNLLKRSERALRDELSPVGFPGFLPCLRVEESMKEVYQAVSLGWILGKELGLSRGRAWPTRTLGQMLRREVYLSWYFQLQTALADPAIPEPLWT